MTVMFTGEDEFPDRIYVRTIGELFGGVQGRANRAQLLELAADRARVTHERLMMQAGGRREEASDPLSWAETETLLRRLAAAERGSVLIDPPDEPTGDLAVDQEEAEDRRADIAAWTALATAATRDEHAGAAAALVARLEARVTRNAVWQFAKAASACTDSYPASYPETVPAPEPAGI